MSDKKMSCSDTIALLLLVAMIMGGVCTFLFWIADLKESIITPEQNEILIEEFEEFRVSYIKRFITNDVNALLKIHNFEEELKIVIFFNRSIWASSLYEHGGLHEDHDNLVRGYHMICIPADCKDEAEVRESLEVFKNVGWVVVIDESKLFFVMEDGVVISEYYFISITKAKREN